MPRWNGEKETYDHFRYKADAYLDAAGLLGTANGDDISDKTDPNLAAAYKKRNLRVFGLWLRAINSKKVAGMALLLQIEDEFKQTVMGLG